MQARIRRIWPIRNRLLKEQNGEITWNEWRHKDVKEKFKNLIIDEQEEKRRGREVVYGASDKFKKSQDFFREIHERLPRSRRKQRKP